MKVNLKMEIRWWIKISWIIIESEFIFNWIYGGNISVNL